MATSILEVQVREQLRLLERDRHGHLAYLSIDWKNKFDLIVYIADGAANEFSLETSSRLPREMTAAEY